MRRSTLVCAIAAFLLTSTAAIAAPVIYTDRTTFEQNGGGTRQDVDFNGVGSDDIVPVDVGPFTVTATETETRVDVPPPPFSVANGADIDGSPYLFVQLDDTGSGESVTFTFDDPVLFLGFEVNPADARTDNLGDAVSFSTNGGDVGEFFLPDPDAVEFRGLQAMNPFTEITFEFDQSQSNDSFTEFGADNVTTFSQVAPVPEPTSLALFGLLFAGASGVAWRRRKRNKPQAA